MSIGVCLFSDYVLSFNGEKEKAISYAENAIKKGGQYYDLQLRQLVGHAYFEKRKFKEALPYLETFVNKRAFLEII